MSEKTRNIVREFRIDATPAEVWNALTRATEITRWFAPFAETQPGADGHISLSWNFDGLMQKCPIRAWTPEEHLNMGWRAGPGKGREVPVDIRLERADGGTLLRLVHSGFLSDASWDEEFESHGRGWSYELRSLKYYLENFLGKNRQHVVKLFPITGDLKEAWSTAIGSSGAFMADPASLEEGNRFELRLPSGDLTASRVFYQVAGTDFAFVSDILQGGLFRFALETFNGQPEIWIWAFSWQLAQRQLEQITQSWFMEVQRRLGELNIVSA
ncbi:MAG: SRPBCC domain-containing protein [Gammaproteobacteria bacterium]|nr:SRPBCC domain-containing protein [Gammaproteobacteria bacterium]